LSPALCDHVLERNDSAKMLSSLAKSGLFISELGGAEGWYRLHPLLQDVLFARLRGSVPLLMRRCAMRAGEWFEEHGNLAAALPCLALTENYPRLLVSAEFYSTHVGFRSSSSSALLDLLSQVPAQELYGRPSLAVPYAAALFYGGAIGELDELILHEKLVFGEGGLDASPEDERLFIVRALRAYGRRDYETAHAEIGRARDACEESMFSLVGLLHFLDSRCLIGLGRWDEAIEAIKRSAWNAHDHQMGEEYLMAMSELSRIQAGCGKVRDAEATLMSCLQYATRHNLEGDAVNFARFAMSFAKREMGEIKPFVETEEHLHTFITEQMQRFTGWLYAPDFFLELARCYVYTRDFDKAASCLASSKDVIKRHLDIPLLPQQTVIARLMIWLSRGEMDRVESWRLAHESRTFTGTAVGAKELDTLCTAISLIASDKPARILALLDEELPDADAIPLMSHRMDCHIVKAWAHLRLGQLDQAQRSRLAALRLSRNGGSLRHFVDWGPWQIPLHSAIIAEFSSHDDFCRYVATVRDNTAEVWTDAGNVPAWQQQRG
ncbi:MAG: hypothetical protein IJG88_00750, partial [Eggerthellaceae bacterium]|nr:hypothetical protein [Eggerthellaceae bacterium]